MLKIFSAIRAVYIDGGGGGLGGFHSLYSLGGKVPAMPEGLAYPAIRPRLLNNLSACPLRYSIIWHDPYSLSPGYPPRVGYGLLEYAASKL
jgi:hypothetical protein